MKSILSLIISGALVVSGFCQTRNVLVGTNNAVVQPTNFWSADASNARIGLGLGTSATNPSSAFQPSSSVLSNLASSNGLNLTNIPVSNVVGALATNGSATNLTNFPASLLRTNGNGFGLTNLNASNITGIIPASNISTISLTNISGTLAVASGGTGATNAGVARTNFGLGATWLTNTNVTNFRTEIGLGTNAQPVFDGALITGDLFAGSLEVASGSNSTAITADGIEFTAATAIITRTNLGLGWPALTNSNAGTGLVSVNTNGDVVSPTNFWQRAPIQTLVQDFTGITVNQTNNATNARNVYVYSLATNVIGISNTIILPTNTSTFNGDEIAVIHKGTTNTTTVVRQAGSTNNLITLNRFDESIKFIRELGQWDFYHNISFVEPIQFSGTNAAANAAASRTNLGLGENADPIFFTVGVTEGTGTNGPVQFLGDGISFPNESYRGLYRTSLGLGTTNNVQFQSVSISNTGLFLGQTNRKIYASDGPPQIAFDVDGVQVLRLFSNTIEPNLPFARHTVNGNVIISNSAPTNGLLYVYRTNNEPFLGLANLIASNNTTVSNETLFRVGIAEATNKAAQFGFRSTNTNGDGVAVFSTFGYNALMMIGPSSRSQNNAAVEADIYSVNPTNRVATLIDTNTSAFALHRPIGFRTNETNGAPVTGTGFNDRARWLEIYVGTNKFYVPLFQ